MKKTFQLKVENKAPERVLETIKKEIRKYIKREKGKRLPEGVDYWDLQCKYGATEDIAKEIKFVDIMKCVDAALTKGRDSFYLEIISAEGIRKPRERDED